MTLLDRLAEWQNPDMFDPGVYTPEEALRQFVFVAISDFIEERGQDFVDWLLTSSEPEVPGLAEWVDEYAERPLTEPSGYGRQT